MTYIGREASEAFPSSADRVENTTLVTKDSLLNIVTLK